MSVTDPTERLAGLFDTHADRLYRLARRLTTNPEDACDLVQDTFVRAAKRSGSIPAGHADEEAWLVRVLINLQRDRWRQATTRAHHGDVVNVLTADTRGGSNQESALIARTTVWKALDALPPRRRAILILHELEGLDTRAIASLLGVTPITVRWHLSRGRRDLASLVRASTGEQA